MSAGRRPKRSEIGPKSSAAPADTSRYMVTARRIVAESAANSAVMSGIDGRNMSIESGARAASVIRIAVVSHDSARAECGRGEVEPAALASTELIAGTRCRSPSSNAPNLPMGVTPQGPASHATDSSDKA